MSNITLFRQLKCGKFLYMCTDLVSVLSLEELTIMQLLNLLTASKKFEVILINPNCSYVLVMWYYKQWNLIVLSFCYLKFCTEVFVNKNEMVRNLNSCFLTEDL